MRFLNFSMLLLVLAMHIPSIAAEDFSTTNLQLLKGNNFHDPYFGNDTSNGEMTTLTLEHFGTWDYGDNFFFIDMTQGDFVGFSGNETGSTSHLYAEWSSRLSLSKLSGNNYETGIFKDFYLAGQLNRDGLGFSADLLGLGVDLKLSGFNVASINAYLRNDNFNTDVWQITTVWSVPIGEFLSFDGFLDLNDTDSNGTEISTQPQLLLDIGHLFSEKHGNIRVGLEWYYHHHDNTSNSVPQVMTQWVW